jgi:hypothetical protein
MVFILQRHVFIEVNQISNLFVLLEAEKQLQSLGDPSALQNSKHHKDLLTEQRYLYQVLNSYHPEGGINQVYVKWNIDSTGRKRKQQICEALFAHPNNLKESLESAELVCKLVGVYKACEEAVCKTKFTHKAFLDEVERAQVQLANNKRGCVLL